MDRTMIEYEARKILGLDEDKWTIQLTDEELRVLQDIMRSEAQRKAGVFGVLQDKIGIIGS